MLTKESIFKMMDLLFEDKEIHNFNYVKSMFPGLKQGQINRIRGIELVAGLLAIEAQFDIFDPDSINDKPYIRHVYYNNNDGYEDSVTETDFFTICEYLKERPTLCTREESNVEISEEFR